MSVRSLGEVEKFLKEHKATFTHVPMELHLELAAAAAGRNLKIIILVGAYAAAMKDAYLEAGGAEKAVHVAADAEAACEFLKTALAGNELLLVKGSRGVHLERVVKFLEKVPV